MAVVETELKLYSPLNNPTNDTDTLGGGIDVTDEVTGGSVGELMIKRGANTIGGADVVAYGKAFYKNTNAIDDLSNSVVWIDNALLQPTANGVLSVVSDSTSDNSDKQVHVIFETPAGVYDSENIVMNGITAVSGTKTIKANTPIKVEFQTVATGDLVATTGNVSINRGSLLGKIPATYKSADGYMAIALEAALNDTETTTNRVTTPGVVTFYVVNTKETGLAVANSGTLTSGAAQGIWLRQTIPDGALPSTELDWNIGIKGD